MSIESKLYSLFCCGKGRQGTSNTENESIPIAVAGGSTTDPKIAQNTTMLSFHRIGSIGMQFWESRILLVAVEIGLFSELSSSNQLSHCQLVELLCLHENLRPDFFDALVSLDILQRTGNSSGGKEAMYSNTPETEYFLVKDRADTYIGDTLTSCGSRLYPTWAAYASSLTNEKMACALVKDTMAKCEEKIAEFKGSEVSPEAILRIGFGFVPSRVLIAAVELNLFSHIAKAKHRKMTANQIKETLRLVSDLVTKDFLETLVEYEMLHLKTSTEGILYYSNTPETAHFLDDSIATYCGGFLRMASTRLFIFWAGLPDALTTGLTQNEIHHKQFFAEMYANPAKLNEFVNAMVGISSECRSAFVKTFDFGPYRTVTDVGGGLGHLAAAIVQKNKHITKCVTTDLIQIAPLANRRIANLGVQDKVTFVASDFLSEDIPSSDVIVMCMILLDWPLLTKKLLIKKIFAALPENGVFVVVESLIDDDRRENTFAFCLSINLLIEGGVDKGFAFTGSDFREWCNEAGFARMEIQKLTATHSMALAYKT